MTESKPLCARMASGDLPQIYAVVAMGDCMEPHFKDGQPIIVSSTATPEEGDTVIIHFRPEFVRPGGYEAIVKRLKYGLYGATFPWDLTGSDVVITATVEQLNPPRTYHIPYDQILAVHKVLGPGKRDATGGVVAPREMVEVA
jgi:Peptidase S24-like